jgi:hypothetical protein
VPQILARGVATLAPTNMSNTVEKILKDAVQSANGCQYCLNCKHSWFNDANGEGLCKYQAEGSLFSMHPKMIQEFHVCDSWTPKTEEKKE